MTCRKQHSNTLPCVLYRYYTFDKYTRNIFEQDEMYFQSANRLNDPFDMKIIATVKGTRAERIAWLEGAFGKAAGTHGGVKDPHALALDLVKRGQDRRRLVEIHRQKDEEARKEMRVFCMTTTPSNILMWTHYTDKHKGFCLGFDTRRPPFNGARQVKYRVCPPRVNLIARLGSAKVDSVDKALFTKAKNWEYEEEWRLAIHDLGNGVHKYPNDALREIIFGCGILPDDKDQIIRWCCLRSPRPAMYEARPRANRFGLDIVSLGGR